MSLYRHDDWLPAEPATSRQVERLRTLADEIGSEAVNYVQAHVATGLDQNEAWRLIGKLGVRVTKERKIEASKPEPLRV